MSKTQLLTAVILGVLVSANTAHAQMHEEHEHEHKGSMMHEEHMKSDESMMNHEESEEDLVKVGNKICPVSGEKVGEMGDVVQVEYNGKLYNLCCKMCKKDFMKNPEKYSAIAEAEVKKDNEEDMEKEMQEHHDHDHHE